MAEYLKTFTEFLKPDTCVVVGVSGGPDSIFLLMELVKFGKKNSIKINVAHVNHGLRKPNCDQEEKFVKDLAKKNNLNFYSHKLSPIKKGNLEEVCRNARYIFFEEIRKKTKSKFIIIAHHADDNIETVLFNLIRGCGIDGMSGMKVFEKERKILRPLLTLSKKEILVSLKKSGTKYFIDQSNFDTKFSRNRIRNVIIPEIEKINPGFKQTFLKNIQALSELNFDQTLAAENWLNSSKEWQLSQFTKLPISTQKNILKTLYKNTYGSTNKFNQNHLDQILKVMHLNQSNKIKEFGDKFFLKILKNKKGQRIFSLIEKKAKK